MNRTHRMTAMVLSATVGMMLMAPLGVHAQFTLVQTGGSFGTSNLATQVGAVAFAKDVLLGGAIPAHQIAHLNDGLYGNNFSWIGDSDPSFAGIRLVGTNVVRQIAFGRNNNTGEGPYGDRYQGTYTIQYTLVSTPSAATPDIDWTTIGTLDYVSSPPPSPERRHLWEFPAVSATGIRVITDPSASFIAIDELELYTIPEPTAATLLGLGVLLLRLRRRR